MTRTHSHTSVHECSQTRSDISTCLYCLHREQEKKERNQKGEYVFIRMQSCESGEKQQKMHS